MPALTTASTLMCPHGGTITATTQNTRVKAGGSPVLTAGDSFQISNCSFTLPGPVSSPCMSVQWVSPDRKSKLAPGQTLSTASVGLCIGSGVQGSVMVALTQPQTATT
jgi:hypothetical protein